MTRRIDWPLVCAAVAVTAIFRGDLVSFDVFTAATFIILALRQPPPAPQHDGTASFSEGE